MLSTASSASLCTCSCRVALLGGYVSQSSLVNTSIPARTPDHPWVARVARDLFRIRRFLRWFLRLRRHAWSVVWSSCSGLRCPSRWPPSWYVPCTFPRSVCPAVRLRSPLLALAWSQHLLSPALRCKGALPLLRAPLTVCAPGSACTDLQTRPSCPAGTAFGGLQCSSWRHG